MHFVRYSYTIYIYIFINIYSIYIAKYCTYIIIHHVFFLWKGISWGCPPLHSTLSPILWCQHASGKKGYGTKNQLVKMFILGGGFKYFLISPLPREMIQFDYIICFRWVKPPTRFYKHLDFLKQNVWKLHEFRSFLRTFFVQKLRK